MNIRVLKSPPDERGAFVVSLACNHNGQDYHWPVSGALTPSGFFTEESWKEVEQDRIAEFKEYVLAQETEQHTVQLKAEPDNKDVKLFVGDKEIQDLKSVTLHTFKTNKN